MLHSCIGQDRKTGFQHKLPESFSGMTCIFPAAKYASPLESEHHASTSLLG